MQEENGPHSGPSASLGRTAAGSAPLSLDRSRLLPLHCLLARCPSGPRQLRSLCPSFRHMEHLSGGTKSGLLRYLQVAEVWFHRLQKEQGGLQSWLISALSLLFFEPASSLPATSCSSRFSMGRPTSARLARQADRRSAERRSALPLLERCRCGGSSWLDPSAKRARRVWSLGRCAGVPGESCRPPAAPRALSRRKDLVLRLGRSAFQLSDRFGTSCQSRCPALPSSGLLRFPASWLASLSGDLLRLAESRAWPPPLAESKQACTGTTAP